MVKEIQTDVIKMIESFPDDGTTRIVIQQANAFNNQGAGIAKALSKAYPQVSTCEKMYKAGDRSKMGNYTCCRIRDNVYVFNAYGQYNYGWLNPLDSHGRQTDYEALKEALTRIRHDVTKVSKDNPVQFYVPLYIGAGHAKGNPKIIQPMVKEIFKDHDLVLFYN